jgi:hypothetical protein
VYALRNGATRSGMRHAAATRTLAAGQKRNTPPLGDHNTAATYSSG